MLCSLHIWATNQRKWFHVSPKTTCKRPGSSHLGFCDGQKWRWDRFSPRTSVYFPCQSTFHLLLHNHLHYHPRLAQSARSGHSANSLTNQMGKKRTCKRTVLSWSWFSAATGKTEFHPRFFTRDLSRLKQSRSVRSGIPFPYMQLWGMSQNLQQTRRVWNILFAEVPCAFFQHDLKRIL
jgi:hypothetical protein